MEFNPTSVINWLVNALIFLGVAYIASYAVTLYLRLRSGKLEGTDALMRTLADDITRAMFVIWAFVRPILQLVIILFVVFWFWQTLGITKDSIAAFGALDIKTVLAFFVIGAFCIASFLSENPATWLKDLALVVVGFYFGTKVGS